MSVTKQSTSSRIESTVPVATGAPHIIFPGPHTKSPASAMSIQAAKSSAPAASVQAIKPTSTETAAIRVTPPANGTTVTHRVAAEQSSAMASPSALDANGVNVDNKLKAGPHRKKVTSDQTDSSGASPLTTASVLQSFGIPSPSSSSRATPEKGDIKREDPVTPEPPLPITPELFPLGDEFGDGSPEVKSEYALDATSATSRGPHHSVPNGHKQDDMMANQTRTSPSVANDIKDASEQFQQKDHVLSDTATVSQFNFRTSRLSLTSF